MESSAIEVGLAPGLTVTVEPFAVTLTPPLTVKLVALLTASLESTLKVVETPEKALTASLTAAGLALNEKLSMALPSSVPLSFGSRQRSTRSWPAPQERPVR